MKKYKYKFSPVLIVLLVLLIAISLLGTGLNLYRFLNPLNHSFLAARPIILAVLSFALLVLAIVTLFASKYEFRGEELYFFVCGMKSKLGAKEIMSVKEYENKNLVLVFSDAKYTVILIKPEQFSSFVDSVKEINPKIIHEILNDKK